MTYDTDNIFAKILRDEIPCKKVFENDHVLAFHDVTPKATVHILVIPKGPYVDMDDFTQRASPEEAAAFIQGVGETARVAGVENSGYRVVSNCGENSGQEVPHLHVHILGGEKLSSF